MKVTLLGATDEVTGSHSLLEVGDLKILVDVGLEQSNIRQFAETNAWNGRKPEYDIEDIDYIILTHFHVDHIGRLPFILKDGFRGKVIATAPTAEACEVAFLDTAKIMQSNADMLNKYRRKNKIIPLYDEEDAREALNYIQCYDYNTEIILSNQCKLELLCAGHVLGASMAKITYSNNGKDKTILFTGDTSAQSEKHPFIRKADDIGDVDYIVSESTYGNRAHDNIDIEKVLTEHIQNICINNSGTILMPVFSMQRSSQILFMLRKVYLKNKEFYKIPIYLDSPMAIKFQHILHNNKSFWGDKWIERDSELTSLLDWEVVEYIDSFQESKYLSNKFPKIILSSSGMCEGGRVLFHLSNILPRKTDLILFSGYQAEGTLGRKLLMQEHKSISINREQKIIRAKIDAFSMSSHADYNQITEYIKTTSNKNKLKKVILNHGDTDAKVVFKEHLKQHLDDVEVMIGEYNKKIIL